MCVPFMEGSYRKFPGKLKKIHLPPALAMKTGGMKGGKIADVLLGIRCEWH